MTPTDPKFHEWIDAIKKFIADPTKENLEVWAAVRNDGRIGNKGYCHPFGDYSGDNGVGCSTGLSGTGYSRGSDWTVCIFKKNGGCVKLSFPVDLKDIPKMVVIAMEYLAVYQSRFPDL